MSFRVGLATLLGRPNTGKSTLVNALVGTKVAIVSPRPQTTRTRLQAVLTRDNAQIVFVDTPGTHEAGTRLNREMMKAVRQAVQGVDLVLLVVDASRPRNEEDDLALQLARGFAGPSLLVLNKIDLIEKEALLPLIDYYRQQHDFRDYLPVSALTSDNLKLLEDTIIANLPEGPPLYPPDTLTDQPMRFLAAEIIREKVLHETRQEVPHAVAVVVDKFEEPEPQPESDAGRHGLVRIHATVFVEREGQKGIVIGAGGQRLKKVGQAAREELEVLLGSRIYLELFVKARADWRDNPRVLELVDWRHGSVE